MPNDLEEWYYDFGEVSSDSDDPAEVFGTMVAAATRTDVESGEENSPFNWKVGEEVEGVKKFTQETVTIFIGHTDIAADSLSDNLDCAERELKQAATRDDISVEELSVRPSPRDDNDGEVEVSLIIRAEGDRHTTTFYLGPHRQ